MRDLIALFLRLALGIAFLSAVADRLGYWGKPGEPYVVWGNWENFLRYVSQLNFGANHFAANIMGYLSTLAETVLGISLIVGYKTALSAALSGLLLLTFALTMSVNTDIKAAFDYSVFTGSFASFFLALQPSSHWSLDRLTTKKKVSDAPPRVRNFYRGE